MTQTVDLQQIKQKLIEKLQLSGWATKLRGFVMSSDFDKIIETLYNEREAGKRFTPPLKYVFRAFEECPVDQLKVVMVGQDPYPYLGIADGIAFSCSLTQAPQPSLQHIFRALATTVYPDQEQQQDPDLTRWANQGILMLNSALTCQIDKPATHYHIWRDFMVYVLDILTMSNSGLIFCLLGKQAQELESLIPCQHYVITAAHPASASYNNGTWNCNDMFNKINEILKQNNGSSHTIQW